MENVIYEYTLGEAFQDGVLRLKGFAGNKPLVVTSAIGDDLPDEEQRQLFALFRQLFGCHLRRRRGLLFWLGKSHELIIKD